jgi:UDP-glucose 4-epimerase
MPVREEQPLRPNDLYGLTKEMGEAICRLFHRRDGLSILALRPVTFIPRDDPLIEGLYLATARGLPADEVVRAHALAVETDFAGCQTAYLAPVVPFTPADIIASRTDPAGVLDRYYPGLSQFFQRHGLAVPPMRFLFATDRARELLGWEARCSIEDWYASARAGR